MDKMVIAAIISFVAGAMSYVIAKYWLSPIFRYHRIRQMIADELVFFEQADEDSLRRWLTEKKDVLRRHSGNLSNANSDLPRWYKIVLFQRSEFPDKAADDLMKLSNTSIPDHARKRAKHITEFLLPKYSKS